jgi:transketolase
MDLRKEFFEQMSEIAERDKDVIVLVGDLGYSFMESYAEKYPKQFINCGIAEQNMIGVASGLARAGKKPYVYSGSIFLCMRAYEQIRDDVAYQNLNVKLIGTGASGFLGFTHNMSEMENEYDLLKNLPNLDLFFPKDSDLLKEALLNDNPTYIRI